MKDLLSHATRQTIAEAEPVDVDELADIHSAAFQHGWSGDDLAALLRHDNVTGLVMRRRLLRRAERAVGFILIRTAADEAEILTLAVVPRARRRGVGRALVEEALRRLYRDGIASVFLEVNETNTAAVTLYRHLGFETVGGRDSYYAEAGRPAGNALVMRRQLR